MKKSNSQKPISLHTHQGMCRSDVSDTQQRAIQTTSPHHNISRSTDSNDHCVPLVNTPNATGSFGQLSRGVLLRKEVIQPHLPVRLPCYDFVPIASPTFDGSPHKG